MAIPPITKTNELKIAAFKTPTVMQRPKVQQTIKNILKGDRNEISNLSKLFGNRVIHPTPTTPEPKKLTYWVLTRMLDNISPTAIFPEKTREYFDKLLKDSRKNTIIIDDIEKYNELFACQNKFNASYNFTNSDDTYVREEMKNAISDDSTIVLLTTLEKIFENCTDELPEKATQFCKKALIRDSDQKTCKIEVPDEYILDLIKYQVDSSLSQPISHFRNQIKNKAAEALMGLMERPKRPAPSDQEEPITKSLKQV